MFSLNQWTFNLHQGQLMTSAQLGKLDLGFPEPTMAFDSSFLIRYKDKDVLSLTTASLLKTVGAKCAYRVEVNSEFWSAKSQTMETVEYDWTYQPLILGLIGTKTDSVDNINYNLLKDTSLPIKYYNAADFYEDELADHGVARMSVKIRVMEWGFFVLLSYALSINNVVNRQDNLRIVHEFGKEHINAKYTAEERFTETPNRLLIDDNKVIIISS